MIPNPIANRPNTQVAMNKPKSNRTSRRIKRLKEQVTLLEANAESLGSSYRANLDDERHRANKAEARLERHRLLLSEWCRATTALPVEQTIPYANPYMRAPVREPINVRMDLDADYSKLKSMPIEELMMIVQRNPDMQRELTHCMHFRVTNAPDCPDFTQGYAVTHTAVRAMRDRAYFVTRIAEEIATGIWQTLYGKATS